MTAPAPEPIPTPVAPAPPAPTRPLPPARNRPPTTAEAFFGVGFGCLGGLAFRLGVVLIVVLVADWRARDKYARREADRAATSATVVRVADELAKEIDSDGRFVRKPEGELPERDAWGSPLRLAYKPGLLADPFSDRLEVRSAGPDGVWQTWDDVTASHKSRISNAALAREAAGGVLDAARDRLRGKSNDKGKTDEKKK